MSKIIAETSEAIYTSLNDYVSTPQSEDDWLRIATQFENRWNMPHVLGCIDGKHVRIECPKLSGSQYFNYKGFFSLVLLAVCDANYCFTLFDLGQYGSNNDSGVLLNSKMGQLFDENSLHVPESKRHEGCDEPLPFYLLGDEIFPLKNWLMRAFPGPLNSEDVKVYNYRHSRGRRTIENAFGILCSRWRIFQKPIRSTVENAESYVMACLALHNYLRQTDNAFYSPQGFMDSEESSGNVRPGLWRSASESDEGRNCFQRLKKVKGSRYSNDAIHMRENLKKYVNSDVGSLPWQLDYVRRTKKI